MFLYEASAKDLLNPHQDSKKYNCSICGIQVSTKESLAQRKMALHEGVKYTCGQCGIQLTTKGRLNDQKNTVHKLNKKQIVKIGMH